MGALSQSSYVIPDSSVHIYDDEKNSESSISQELLDTVSTGLGSTTSIIPDDILHVASNLPWIIALLSIAILSFKMASHDDMINNIKARLTVTELDQTRICSSVTQIGNSNLASATAADTDNLNRIIDQ